MHQTKVGMISKVLLVSELDFTFHCNVHAARTMHFGKVICDQKTTPKWILTLLHRGSGKIFLHHTGSQNNSPLCS